MSYAKAKVASYETHRDRRWSLTTRPTVAERQFTIMRHWGEKGRTRIPWAMIAPHEPQAIHNHSQSLKRLQERGGLGASEAVAVLIDSPCQEDVRSLWKADKEQRALVLYKYDQMLEDLVAEWEADRG